MLRSIDAERRGPLLRRPQVFTVRLPEDLRDDLAIRAASEEVPLAFVVRRALRSYLASPLPSFKETPS